MKQHIRPTLFSALRLTGAVTILLTGAVSGQAAGTAGAVTPAKAAPAKVAAPAAAPAAAASSFGWYAEVVSFDAATGVLTAKAKAEPHIAARTKALKAGDRVVLAWTAYKQEADAVRYVTAEKAMTAESGYLVRGKFVGADAGSITFATAVPAAVAATLRGAKPGTSVRVAAPLAQPGPEAILTAVALNKTAPARPAPAVVKVADDSRQVAGTWDVASNLMGNAVKLVCTMTQNGPKLGGTCNGPGPLAQLPLTGKVEGDEVNFGFSIQQPVSLTLLHRGKLDAAGSKIEGTLDLMGNVSPFTATKK